MKAWISRSAGGPETLALEELPLPSPKEGELLLRVQAVGINFPDSLLIRDLYQVKPPRPLVPGSEFCGVVEITGQDVTQFQPGDVVIGRCGWGAMSEYVALEQDRCVRIPSSIPRTEAAAFLFTYATAYHALRDAGRLLPGERVLVLGAAGGVGSAAIDVARALGGTAFAAASSEEKLNFALARGAVGGLVYDANLQDGDSQKALAKKLKELIFDGANIVLDPIGGPYTDPALRSLARGGRHLVVGFTAGIPRVPLNLALLKRSHIIGVDWRMFVQEDPEGNARNVEALLELWQNGKIDPPVTETFPFESAPQAISRLESRTVLGKVVVVMDQ